MKLFLTVTLCFIIQICVATTFYISPAGSDQSGNGSSNNPWRSLFKATSVVTEPGSVIHVMAGTYTEISRSILAPGVSIEGEGVSSVILSTLTEEFVAIIIARSAEGTDGNQHISNLKLDGNNRTTSWGIEIRGRKNFSIHDCMIVDFEDRGVLWGGRDDNEELPPAIYATGNSFYNNILKNCAKYTDYGRGCLNIGGQEGMLIYNNTIEQTGRAKGTNGWPIKYWNGGFLKGCKIYNNNIIKEAYDGSSWDFAIELFNEYGLEIYKNRIIGCIDLNHQNKGDYPFGAYIHDNVIGPEKPHTALENGITLEFETNDVIIENNTLKNLGVIVNFTPRENDLINNVLVKNNKCENIGVEDGSHQGFALRIGRDDEINYFIQKIEIINNEFIGHPFQKPYWGVGLLGALKVEKILIQKNIFSNFSAGFVLANPAYIIDSIVIENNTLSKNGNNNSPSFNIGTPLHYQTVGNLKLQSSVFSYANLKMNIIRPLYYEMKSYDRIELVLMFATVLCFFLAFSENAYSFPIGLIWVIVSILINLDKELFGEVLLSLCYIPFAVFGWMQWRKRDRRKHRIIRINTSNGREKLQQLLAFIIFYIIFYSLLFFYKIHFTRGVLPLADAFILSSGFVAIGLFTKKKMESWYWGISCATLAIPVYFEKHNLVTCLYFSFVFLLCAYGIFKWRKKIQKRQNKIVHPQFG